MNPRRVAMLLLALSLAFGGQCAPSDPDENLLQPRQWMQLQSDEQGTGYNGVHTGRAVLPARKWTAGIGDVAFSSPVADHQGRIWVGNVAGELVGINPNGTLFARKYVGGTIVSSPAVDESGRVFVLAQYPDGDSFFTRLHVYDPAIGQFAPLVNPPPYKSTASPKIWGNYVFVPADRTLRVFDRWTLQLVDETVDSSPLVCGFFDPPEWLGYIGDMVLCWGTLYTSELIGLSDCIRGFNLSPPGEQLVIEPSVAIVDNPTIVEDVNRPIVVMVSSQYLTAFNFDPSGSPKLRIRWQRELVEIDCDFKYLRVTTPAVLASEQVVIGDDKGQVRSFSIHDGEPLWSYGASERIQAPPVAGVRQIYVVTEHYLVVLDSNGTQMSTNLLNGIGGGVSMSLDYAYVMTTEGIHSYDIGNPSNPSSSFDGSILDGTHLGKTVPAIDRDGNVYLSTPNGLLVAYSAGPSSIAFVLPQAAWLSPAEGQAIPNTAGQPLRVSLAGGAEGFTGDLAISSDVDGILCQFHVDRVNEGACVTTAPLTLGPHVLTVFATDESGGQQTAQINVDAVKIGPTVAITSPSEGQSIPYSAGQSLQVSLTGGAEGFTGDVVISSDVNGMLCEFPVDRAKEGSCVTTAPLTLGLHVLTAVATDASGGQQSATVRVEAVNIAPTVVITSPADQATLFSNVPILLAAQVADAEEGTIPPDRIVWQSDIGGNLGTGASLSVLLGNGVHRLSCVVTDEKGATETASITITVTAPIF